MKKILILKMALILIFALPSVSVFAISPSDAFVNIDFSKGIPDGMEVIGGELVNDDAKGQVMSFPGSGKNKVNGRNSKAALVMESFASSDFTAGISWTVWVKGTADTHGMEPIFTIDLARQGYLSLLADLTVTLNATGNEAKWGFPDSENHLWSDPPNPLEDEESAIGTEWVHLAVVIKSGGVYLYKNAKQIDVDPWANGNFGVEGATDIMMKIMPEYATGVTLGAYKCDWWRFGDFKGSISSAALYNKALTEEEIKELFVSSGGVYEEPPATEAPTVPATDPPATEVDDNNNAESAVDETAAPTSADKAGDENGNNNALMIILIAAGVAVIAFAVVMIIQFGKKGKKADK